jgi:ParB family chromosome partitioning protein
MSVQAFPQLSPIAVNDIDVLNPRERNQRIFDTIIANIQDIGLKKPVTVTPRQNADGQLRYLLICGEGRLKAFRQLGETHIPALVVEVDDEDAFIMSLTENIARRQNNGFQSLAGVDELRKQGYSCEVIIAKTGLAQSYVSDILTLLNSGEERLLDGVAKGRLPIKAAITIARAGTDSTAVRAALQDAYESGLLRGNQLKQARRVIERRELCGRTLGSGGVRNPRKTTVTANSLVKSYQQEVTRQKQMVRKAEFAQQRLLFITGALRELLADDHFMTLLRAEGLDTLPRYLAERLHPHGGGR